MEQQHSSNSGSNGGSNGDMTVLQAVLSSESEMAKAVQVRGLKGAEGAE